LTVSVTQIHFITHQQQKFRTNTMDYTIEQLLKTYVGLRDEVSDLEKTFKRAKSDKQTLMAKIELLLRDKCEELGVDNVSAGGLTAYSSTKDRVSISSKDTFAQFLVKSMLTNLQPHMYFTEDGGTFNDFGEVTLQEHVDAVLSEGTLELLTLSANKTNCKAYMDEHEGLMPDGVSYASENVITVRKGRGKK